MNIKTETEHCDILSAFDLTDEEIGEFDYLEETEGSFFRYNGNVYDLGAVSYTHLTLPTILLV